MAQRLAMKKFDAPQIEKKEVYQNVQEYMSHTGELKWLGAETTVPIIQQVTPSAGENAEKDDRLSTLIHLPQTIFLTEKLKWI